MKYRLDTDHYLHDRILGPGTEVGDDTPYPFRFPVDVPRAKIRAGQAMLPSQFMTPLDEEAQRAFRARYGTDAIVDNDPFRNIPLSAGGPDGAVEAKPFSEDKGKK